MLVLIFGICLVTFLWWGKRRSRNMRLPPPFEDQWPIIGCTHKLLGRNTTEFLKVADELGKSCLRNGGVVTLNLGPSFLFAITDPDDSTTILNNCLEKNWAYEFVKPWVGDGLVSVTDNLDIWKRHRKIISKSFNSQILEGYMDIFNKQARKLIQELAPTVAKGPFVHEKILEDISWRTMYRTTMGLSEEEMKSVYNQETQDAIRDMLFVIIQRFQCFWLISDFIYSFTSVKKREDEAIMVLHRAAKQVITRKRIYNSSTMGRQETKFKSFLDLLLDLPPQEAFSDKEIMDEVNTMIAAGSDTSATMLTFALILLGSHQDIQDKVIAELKTVFGNSQRDVDKQDLSKLVYTEAMLLETMRLYPILPVILRYVARDVNIKNYTLPAGSTCFIMVRTMHRDPQLWGENAEDFVPERWLPNPPPVAARAYAGFSIGKRNCIGKAYAMMSMKTTLAHLLRHYRIVADITKLELKLESFLKPASGCEIALQRRTEFNCDKK